MAKSVQIASVFIKLGIQADTKELNRIISTIEKVVKQAKALKQEMSQTYQVMVKTRQLDAAHLKIERLRRDIQRLKGEGQVKLGATGIGGAGRRRMGYGGGWGGSGYLNYGGMMGGPMGFAPMLGGISAAAAVTSVVRTAMTKQGIIAGLTAATGTTVSGELNPDAQAGQGTQAFAYLAKQADRLGLSYMDLGRTYTNLIAAGKSVGFSLTDSQELFTAASEASRVLNLSVADTEGVMRAFTQMLSKGKVSAEELRQQLGERLPGALGMAADALGITVEELDKLLASGKIYAKDLLPLMTKELAKFARTNGALAVMMESTHAWMMRFINALNELSLAIADTGFMDYLADMFHRLIIALDVLEPALIKLAQIVLFVLEPFMTLLNIIDRLDEMLPDAAQKWGLLGTVLYVAGMAMMRFGIAAAFVGKVMKGMKWFVIITAVLYLIEDIMAFVQGDPSLIGDIWVVLQNVWAAITSSIRDAVEWVEQLLKAIGLIEETDSEKKISREEDFIRYAQNAEEMQEAGIVKKLLLQGENSRMRAAAFGGAYTTDAQIEKYGSEEAANLALMNQMKGMSVYIHQMDVSAEDAGGMSDSLLAEAAATLPEGNKIAHSLGWGIGY